ncbi:hypothetical protein JCM10021v2_007450 [Rhodotorula toruloides]
MADSATSSHGLPTMREAIEAAEKAGEAAPTVEAYLRGLAYPFPDAPKPDKYARTYGEMLDGDRHMPEGLHDLSTQMWRVADKLIPLCARRMFDIYSSKKDCHCVLDRSGLHSRLPVQLLSYESDEEVLELLDNLRSSSASDESASHAWGYHPFLEATSPWRWLHGRVAFQQHDEPLLAALLGKTCFVPIFVLSVASSDLPTSPPNSSARGPTLAELGLGLDEVATILADLAPTPKPVTAATKTSGNARLVVFGASIPINAPLATHGASYIHTLFAAGSTDIEATIRSQIHQLCDMNRNSPASSSADISGGAVCTPAPAATNTMRQQHYRLATFDELQKGGPISAAFVCSDGSLATLHTFTPLSYGDGPSEPVPLLTPAPTPAIDAVVRTEDASDSQQQGAKPLLLLASGSMGSGNQGVLYLAHCADAPFLFLAKYSHPGHVCCEMIANEVVFYRRNGLKLVEEKLAPRFVRSWSAEGKASPYSDGSATTILLVEEWGERVAERDWCDVDRETRQAVLDLSIRFHLKTGYCHGSLRCDNILWKPNIGPSSLRLVDFARSEKSCACMEGECCEELYKLSLALHRVETYELVEASMTVDSALRDGVITISDLVEEAQKAGEASPTVETFLRRVAYPFETMPFPQDRHPPRHDVIRDGNERSGRPQTLVQTGKDCRLLLVIVLGETHFTPLLVLDVDSSNFPSFSPLEPAHNPHLLSSITDPQEAKTVLARLVSPSYPTETKTNSMRSSSPLLVVFGPKLPVNATLQKDGASFIHTIYGAGNEEVEGKIRAQVLSLLESDKTAPSAKSRATAEVDDPSKRLARPRSPSPVQEQEYRLVTFDELKKNLPFNAAFVCPDGSLATLHSFSPLPLASSPPTSPTTATPSSSSDAPQASRANGVRHAPVAPKPLLLLAADKQGGGNQGYVYRAHCADSPFPLIAKYSRCGSSSNAKVADEAKFYRKHGEKMVEEELAPRFVGAWVAEEGEASPYKMGGSTTLLLTEEWGTSVSAWCHLSRAERNAVRELAVRFHLKLEACHGSLKADNVVWKREVGASSFRLIDFARSDDEDCMCRTEYPCCEELITLAKSLAWADMVEMVDAERERLKLAAALAVVGEEERRLCVQARLEKQLQVRFYRFSDSFESLLDGTNWRHSEAAAPVLGLYHLPNLSSVLSEAGLAYLFSRSTYAPETPLTSVSSSSHRDRLALDHFTHPPRDSHELRDWLRDLYPELLPPCASNCIGAYDEPSCQCPRDNDQGCPRNEVRFSWCDEADQDINFLEHLSSTSTAAASTLHAWEYHPLVEATSPWRSLNEAVKSGSGRGHALVLLVGDRDYLPLFFLDLDPSECAGLPFKPHPETTFADLGLSAEESASILTRLAPTPVPVKDGDEAKSAIRPSKLVVFGSRTRINAALSRNGASLIHTMYASGSEDVAAQLRARVLPAGKAGESVASSVSSASLARSSATPIGSNSPSTPREQEYRLVSYDELGKGIPFHAAFLLRNGTLTTLHSFTPLSPSASSPSSLLRGQPGYLYRAYCADSPIPLLAKYSKDDDNSASMITKEARFYRQHEATLRSEELAPICLGGWSAEGTASPYTRGHAVRDLIVRFHFKLGCQHRSLRGDNIVWKPDVGPSSFRLMDFARSNNNCYCMRGQLCEELFELEEDLHRIDYFETLKARREAERVDQALAAVDEAERELRDQARREGELAA